MWLCDNCGAGGNSHARLQIPGSPRVPARRLPGAGSGLCVWGSRHGGLQAGLPQAVQCRPSSQDAANPFPSRRDRDDDKSQRSQPNVPHASHQQHLRVSSQCWASYDEPEGCVSFFPPFNRVTGGIWIQLLRQNLYSHALPPSLTQCQAGGRQTRARGMPDCAAYPRTAEPGSKSTFWWSGFLREGGQQSSAAQILGPQMPS